MTAEPAARSFALTAGSKGWPSGVIGAAGVGVFIF